MVDRQFGENSYSEGSGRNGSKKTSGPESSITHVHCETHLDNVTAPRQPAPPPPAPSNIYFIHKSSGRDCECAESGIGQCTPYLGY